LRKIKAVLACRLSFDGSSGAPNGNAAARSAQRVAGPADSCVHDLVPRFIDGACAAVSASGDWHDDPAVDVTLISPLPEADLFVANGDRPVAT
jgi:hypothetical protein